VSGFIEIETVGCLENSRRRHATKKIHLFTL